MLNDDIVIGAVSCPLCGARRGDPCTYLAPAYPSRKNSDKVGKPTLRPHGPRRNRWTDKRRAEARKKALEQAKVLPPHVKNLIEIRQSQVDFERRENAAVAAWMREHGLLLIRVPAKINKEESHG